MATDLGRSVVVMFGGQGAGVMSDTWEWNGVYWESTAPVTSPSARVGHVMAYDSARSVTVLFGGSPNPILPPVANDTWEWNGTTWTQVATATAPSEAVYSSMCYDSQRGVVQARVFVIKDMLARPVPTALGGEDQLAKIQRLVRALREDRVPASRGRWGFGGFVRASGPATNSTFADELRKIGTPAVPMLIDALDSQHLTRIVWYNSKGRFRILTIGEQSHRILCDITHIRYALATREKLFAWYRRSKVRRK